MNNDEIRQDFRRRYEGTYVKLAIPNKSLEVVARIMSVQEDSDKFAQISMDTKEFGRIQTCFGSEEYQIKFDYPKAGVFQGVSDALCYRRRCERQYVRGCSANNSTMTTTSTSLVPTTTAWNLNNVSLAFEHKTHALKDALEMLKKGVLRSVALDKDFSIAASMKKDSDEHLIFHWTSVVGKCDSSGKIKMVYEPIVAPLMEEVFNG